jgi:hypothetical protein
MNRRGAGVGSVFIAAVLFSTRYIAAAMYGANTTLWGAHFFDSMLEYVGNELLI